jgi:iron(III) transport system permease protein
MIGARVWRNTNGPALLLFGIPALIVTYLVVPPLALLIVSTFKSTADRLPLEPGPWTLVNYIQAFTDADTFILFRTSVIFALATVIIALAIGIALVWLIERTDLPGRNVVLGLVLAPLAIPALVKAVGWALMANPNQGILNVLLRNWFGFEGPHGPINIYSLGGMIFVASLSHVPSVILMVAGAFRNLDPTLEEASQTSGGGWVRTQSWITMPLLRPALLAAAVYFFAAGLDDFQIPAVLGLNADIQVFSTRIYLSTHPARGLPDFGLASTYSMLLLVVALGVIALYRHLIRHSERFVVVTGKAYRPLRAPLGKWKYAAYAGVSLYLLFAAVLPMLTLAWISLQPFFAAPTAAAFKRMSFINYENLFDQGQFQTALWNTILIAPIVATATMLLATLVAWNSARSKLRISTFSDLLTFVNMAVPTVVFGLAVLFVYLSVPPLRIFYGTIWILIFAFIARYLTYTTRLMSTAIIQIHKELEEASETSGGSRWSTFWRITLPLLLPSFVNGWVWVLVYSLREATLAVMLMTPSNVVLASLIWSQWQQGSGYGIVASMSVVMVAATTVLTLISRLPVFNRVRT